MPDFLENRNIYEEFAELNEDPSYFLDLRLIPNKPNFDATIGIFCYDFKDFFALKEVVRKLPKAEFVLAPALYDIKNYANAFYYNVLIRRLNKEGLPWRIFIPYHYSLVHFFGQKYRLLVSRRPSPLFNSAELLMLKKIRIIDADPPKALAGAEVDLTADLFLVPGPEEEYPFRHFSRAKDAGIARLDFFTKIPQPLSKKKFLYLPNSLEHAEQFAQIAPHWKNRAPYEVKVRLNTLPHGLSLEANKMWLFHKVVHLLEDSDIDIAYENEDVFYLISEADIIMVDDGYFLFDILFLQKPFIFYEPNFERELFLPRPYPKPANWRDFTKRNFQILNTGIILQKMQNLPAAFEEVHLRRENLRSSLEGLLGEKLISAHNNQATDRAAEILLDESVTPRAPETMLARIMGAAKLDIARRHLNPYPARAFDE